MCMPVCVCRSHAGADSSCCILGEAFEKVNGLVRRRAVDLLWLRPLSCASVLHPPDSGGLRGGTAATPSHRDFTEAPAEGQLLKESCAFSLATFAT